MKIDIQIDSQEKFQIESNTVPRIGDTLQVRLPEKLAGQDIILPKVRYVYWNLLNLPEVSVTVFAETSN
jgi:hypothetical protein